MRGLIARITALLALGVVDYEVHRPWRLFVVLVIGIYIMEWVALRHRREGIRIIRQRRHRLANQLQLVTGWLQLGATAKAEEALQKLMDAEASQSMWFRGLPSHWSYLFLRWDARSEECGVTIRWDGLDTLSTTYRMAWILERRLAQAMRMTTETAILVQFRGERFRIHIAERPSRVPRGWLATPDGLEFVWGGGRRRTPISTGRSAGM